MLLLIVGLLLFFAIHLVPTIPHLRDGLTARMGRSSYQIAFSVISLAGLVLIAIGYGKMQMLTGSKNPELWSPPVWTRHLAFLLMIPAFILLVAAYVPSRIRTAAKHPMLAAIKIWAFSHLLANGDLASLVLFGSFLAYAVYDRISVKHRVSAGPLGNAKGGLSGDAIAVVGGLALYGVMMVWGHSALIGVPLIAVR